jgi:subtilisin family serine protease
MAATPAHAAGRYIVTVEPGVSPAAAAEQARDQGARVGFVYRHALRGYSATLPDALLRRLRSSARVASIVPDTPLRFTATQASPPSYGIDRVDQRALPLSGSYTYGATGAGVDAYIIDTGIRLSHQDFGGRAVTGVDLIDGGESTDCYGHGTHVAGTVGGNSYGVAKGVRLVDVRIGACTNSLNTSTAIAGIDWVTGNHQPGQPAVANMSFGGGTNSTMDTAVKNMIADGVVAAIAAGNGNVLGQAVDACTSSPPRVPEALTISSTNSTDNKVGYANYGTCVDMFAPGYDIVSASYQSDTGSATMGGTSMAAPHVAGAVAMYLETNRTATPAQVGSALNGNATTGVVKSPGSGTPNRLLYTGFITGGGGGTPVNAAPVASFTSSCSGLTCSFDDTSTDSDGTIASRSWNFDDGSSSTAANPSKTYAAAGTYTVTLTVTDDKGATNTTSKSVTVTSATTDPDPATPTLTSGVARQGTSAAGGGWTYFKIQVPSGRSQLRLSLDGPACGLFGCSPDLDLFGRRAAKPTTSVADCRAETGSSDETCTISNPAADWYYVGVYTYSGSSGASFSITATYS